MLVVGALHAVSQPATDGEVHDVHELDADVVAIGLLEEGQDVAERAWAATAERAGVEYRIEVGLAEAEGGEGEVRVFFGGQAEGIEMSEGVAEGAVGEEEVVDPSLGKNVAEFGGGTAVGGGGAGAGGWAELATEFKAFEESPPGGIDGGSIGFPGFVEFLEEGSVAGVAEPAQSRGGSGGRAIWVQALQGF